ncbi:MAG: quinone oxidoreductase [Chloroflexi bacterium]|nr:quinone oxidoreductase [Chloroflexota bacterium]
MKAVRIHQFGAPEVLQYEDIPVPEPKEGEVRVKIQVIGINFIDTYRRTGLYKMATPFIVGEEAAGVVDAVGAGVTDSKIGERVVYCTVQGSYAEYAIVPAWRVVQIPQNISARDATAIYLQGLTAHYLAHDTFPIKSGDTALIQAAASGAGQLLVQIAKMRGARIIGTTSSDDKARIARAAGADEIILYTQKDFEAETKRLTNGKGVDVVYDSVGKTTAEKSLNCLRPRGMLVLWGNASGAAPAIDPLALMAKGSLFVTRPTLTHYTRDRAELIARAKDLFAWMTAGKLRVRIDKTFALKDAADAHRYVESRASAGKVLLIP